MDIRLDGLDALINNLNRLGNVQSIEEVALTKAGEHLRDEIKNNVPVQKIQGGGQLRDSISVSEVSGGKVSIGSSVSSKVSHRAHFVEFGTSEITAVPFLRTTFEVEKRNIEGIIGAEIRRALGL